MAVALLNLANKGTNDAGGFSMAGSSMLRMWTVVF
jgi:hypothetical protein